MHLSPLIYCFYFVLLTNVHGYPITYDDVRGTPYKVGYDHRAITINGNRTMLISGAIHYPRSTPAMWPYLMKMAKNQGLNTIQTYVFWNLHEPRQGILDFSGRANLSQFLSEAANAGLFVNLRLGPYVCAEWDNGGLPVWLNNIPNISFRSNNDAWKSLMRKYLFDILNNVEMHLAKNGGPIIIAQIENEYHFSDTKYIDWCGNLVTNDLSSFELVWIMCNGLSANSTIETCNSCNCLDDGWINRHYQTSPDKPMMFTENEGWFEQWGQAPGIRRASDLGYSVGEWFAAGGSYHAYYMWHGGNNYGRTAASSVTTMYANDVCLHSDGTPNEPKYTHLRRLQHLIANYSQILLNTNPLRILIPYWDGKQWTNSTQQFLFSYSSSIHFLINQFYSDVVVLFRNETISINARSIQIYDENIHLLWDSSIYNDIIVNNTQIIPIVNGPLEWRTWTESNENNLPKMSSEHPLEQLNVTNDETIYLWYRCNITLKRTLANTIIQAQTRLSNALLFFLDGQFLGQFDNHVHAQGGLAVSIAVDLSNFKSNQEYLFEVLSISLGLDNGAGAGYYEMKGLLADVWIDGAPPIMNPNQWQHQKGLLGEYLQIYTEEGSTKVDWNTQWNISIDKPVTWFQAHFDLQKNLLKQDLNVNPILVDAQGLNRGHIFINGYDIGLYWLIQGVCQDQPNYCQQAQINCLQPTQRYYHIPSDWLKPTNNLITIFDDLGAPAPQSVGILQHVVTN